MGVWAIIRPHVAQLCIRLVMAWCLLLVTFVPAVPAMADAAPPGDTWRLLDAPREAAGGPIFALDADPGDPNRILLGTAEGSMLLSQDGGASWRQVAGHLGSGVLAVAFEPGRKGLVLAGTRGAGIWRSADGGGTWIAVPGTAPGTVHAFGSGAAMMLAATDRGVLTSKDGSDWRPAGLSDTNLSAVASSISGNPPRLVAAGDEPSPGAALPLYTSPDGGSTWTRISGSMMGSTMVSALTGWLGDDGPRMVLGTDAGAFMSRDSGAHWGPLTGGGTLPAASITAARTVAGQPQRLYLASDGGASDQGGLWSTRDAGQHFVSLHPPIATVTALAAGSGPDPMVYVATFRPIDHAVMLWAYRDAGGPPGQQAAVPPPRTAARPAGTGGQGAIEGARSLLGDREAPFIGLGLGAVLILLLAGIAYLRSGRRL